MKIKKLLCVALTSALCVFPAITLTGCSENTEVDTKEDTENAEAEETSKETDKAIEIFSKLEATNSIEEMSSIIGFEPEMHQGSSLEYKWAFDDKTYIKATVNDSFDASILQLTLDENAIASDEVNFLSCYSDIQETPYTYEEIVEKLGGVEGVLSGKTSTSKAYVWVDKHGQTLRITFSDDSDGKSEIVTFR